MKTKRCTLIPILFILAVFMPIPVYAQDYYWNDPLVLVEESAEFMGSASGGGAMAAVWQDRISRNADGGSYSLSLVSSDNGTDWKYNRRFLGPYSYTGNENYFFSVAMDDDGSIFLAVSGDDNSVTVYKSADTGESFEELYRFDPLPVRVSPQLSLREDGGFILFVTQEAVQENFGSLGIFYAVSGDGKDWAGFRPLAPEFQGNFLPSHASRNGREYVVFQAFIIGATSTFQLYLKYSDDGGETWSEPVFLTGFEDLNELYDGNPYVFDNQRPDIAANNGGLSLVWERNYFGGNPQIYFADLDISGRIRGVPEQVSRGDAECRKPVLSFHRGRTQIMWFDNRAGDYHNILAERDGLYWDETDLNRLTPGASTFGKIMQSGGDIYVVWENKFRDRSRIQLLAPDKFAPAPLLRAADFRAGVPAAKDNFRVRWNSPQDSSGIAGYSYSFDRDPDGRPEERLVMLDRNRDVSVTAEEDGSWYFHVIAQDYAGNWSETSSIEINRDTTPPGKVVFAIPETGEDGSLLSNSRTLSWLPPEDPDLAGYSYSLQYVGTWRYSPDPETVRTRMPSTVINSRNPSFSFSNMDNGLWVLSVRAVDGVGNTGETERLFFRLNKYIPVTYITEMDSSKDELGNIMLNFSGRGFSAGGNISRVILDTDGKEPYDYIFSEEDGLYTVVSDRKITGPVVENIETGTYRIGLVHPQRGLYFTRGGMSLESSGTIKFGDFSDIKADEIRVGRKRMVEIPFRYLAAGLLVLLCSALFMLTLHRTASVVRESREMDRQLRIVFDGGIPEGGETSRRIKEMARIRMGLRVKFALLLTGLVLLVIVIVSVPIAIITSENQRNILSGGLEARAGVLLESITSGARTFLPAENLLELSALPAQMSALGGDAVFVTITGPGSEDSPSYEPDVYDYVWATNDQNQPQEARTGGGSYLVDDDVSPLAAELARRINTEADAGVSLIAEEIQRLNEQVEPLVERFIRTGDEETESAINEIQNELRRLDGELNMRLYEIGNVVSSFPEYDPQQPDALDNNYTFYKPIVYRSQNDNSYFHGLVRLGVSTEGIKAKIEESRKQLLMVIGAIAAVAVVLGILGAMLLAAIIIRPINLLVRGVELIRDTEDKEKLHDHVIKIKTGDELSVLADTVNQMTEGLVKAAAANKDLTVGKEVQKMFIPLEKDRSGRKLSTGKEEDGNIAFFGYYEGAKGVSGDYFDFRKIDAVHYAAIKCDVAGKGVPASLIMVEVATIFLSFFRDRPVKKDKNGNPLPPDIAGLAYSINDMLEERGFKGRFAALIIIIINSVTGEIRMCNAGDKLVHFHDIGSGSMVIKELPEAPAAGVFPSDLVRMGSGFTAVKDRMKKGDSMMLFTDGLEEAQRKFRDENFNIIECAHQGLERGQEHDTHPVGNNNEEFGIPRIQALVNAVMAKQKYKLYKYHNPLGDEDLVFDFTQCEGSIEDVVMSSVAVERVFRIYRDPSAGPDDRVLVDKKIDDYLKKHFLQYENYFSRPVEAPEDSMFNIYSHLKEDEQYDDLTILGIRKK